MIGYILGQYRGTGKGTETTEGLGFRLYRDNGTESGRHST